MKTVAAILSLTGTICLYLVVYQNSTDAPARFHTPWWIDARL